MHIDEAKRTLKKYFGFETFRPMQEEIIQSIYNGRDNVVLMPTGGGKSICYQIPAITMPGTCVVVSPLISLMKDQVQGLKTNGVSAAFLNSSLSQQGQSTVEKQAQSGQLDLLYVSPEKLLTGAFFNFLKTIPLNLFAIDEAHCISAWGHDFRPEYAKMKIIRRTFPDIPIVALTATADKLTRKDIADKLGLDAPQSFVASFDRPNLSLTVLPGRQKLPVIIDFVKERPGQSGIIYCLSRKKTEDVAAKLNQAGIPAAHYHAGLTSEERSRIQDRFINDTTPIICATIAFGMGIDKSNVRWVIHHNLPKNIEGYYQEIGRSGRDGLPSDTLLFYSFGDVMILRKMIDDSQNREVQLAKLQRMQEFAEARICRRKILLNYFGEHLEANCNNCDVCKNPPQYMDGTIIAQKALSAVVRMDEKVAAGMLIDVLRGSGKVEVMANGYHEIKTYGAGKDISYANWQMYIMQLIQLGLLEIAYDRKHALTTTTLSDEVLKKGKKVELVNVSDFVNLRSKSNQRTKRKTKTEIRQDALLEVLISLRTQVSREYDLAPYQVFSDATLNEMKVHAPMTKIDMMKISGVSNQKFDSFGERFIESIYQFVLKQLNEGVRVKGTSHIITYRMYKAEVPLPEIAKKRKLKLTTIHSHLVKLYEDGYDVEIRNLLSESELELITQAIVKTGVLETTSEIQAYLHHDMHFSKIKIGQAIYKKEKEAKPI